MSEDISCRYKMENPVGLEGKVEFSGLNSHESRQTQRQRPQNVLDNDEESCEVRYGAAQVINLFVPVSCCMLAVIFSMRSIGYFTRSDGVYLIYTPFTKQTDSAGELFIMSVGNALTLLCVVIIMTVSLYLLYKFRCYKVIHGWLIMSSVMLLGLFSAMYFEELLKHFNLAVDYITFIFFVWNFAVLGMISVHWKGPIRLQQGYLIIMSALMALVFIKHLPEWSVWTVLAGLAIWDLVAVLCPRGPLRALVETAQERNEPIFPALIYSSTVMYSYVMTVPSFTMLSVNGEQSPQPGPSNASANDSSSNNHTSTTTKQKPIRMAPLRGKNTSSEYTSVPVEAQQQVVEGEEEERGVKLGLGDFIFYSVLVGKACSYGDWNTTIACYIAILLGLSFTLMLLAMFRKALPALPISIFAGIIFYFATMGIITPFLTEVSMRQYLL